MARRALGPAALAVLQAVAAAHRGEPLLVACSGGADSLALAAAAVRVAQRTGCAARAVVVDHGVQPGSAEVAAGVVATLAELDLAAEVVAVDVRPAGEGLEAAARIARYAALAEARRPQERCYLGHTLDDQAETVLLGLARGSGLRSLAGMPAERDGFVRPLLAVTRAVTRQSCQEQRLTWWDDPHNADPRFARARVRERVLPVLEAELGPGVAAALVRTAELAREDAEALDALAAGPAAAEVLDCAELLGHPAGLRQRIVRTWLQRHGARDLSRGHVLAVAALVTDWHGQQWVEVPGLRVARREGRLHVLS